MNFLVVKMRHIIIALLILAAIPVVWIAATKTADVFNVNGKEITIYSVERSDNKIAITFDCAWNDEDIDSILDTLDKYKCKATFFVVGDWVRKYPQSLKKISDRGHEIGNHSYNHADYTKLSTEEIKADIKKADECIKNICGEAPLYMRMPSGAYNDNAVISAESCGKICVQWSVDSLDYKENATEDSILSRLVKTKEGDILLMHNGTKLTSKLLPKIIKGLKKNYEFVSLDELIYREGFEVDASGRQVPIK